MMRKFRKNYKNIVVWGIIASLVLSIVFSLVVSMATIFVQ